MIRTMVKTIQGARALSRGELRQYVRSYIDDTLRSYGYARRPNGMAGVLPILGAFGAGVAVGTGIGVLVAPTSGKETRAVLMRQIEGVVKKVREPGAHDGRSTIITDDPAITHGGPMGHT